MNSGRRRQAAYADLLTGLIDLGPMTASNRFDELLEQARAQGRIDDDTARVLRWWQREALRAQADHVLATAPSLLAALDLAQRESVASADLAEQAWGEASQPAAPVPVDGTAPTAEPPIAESATATAPTVDAQPEPEVAPAPADDVAAGVARSGRHRAAGAEAARTETPLFDTVLAAHDPAPTAVAPVQAPEALADAPDDEPVAAVLDLASPARRRRLLVAGLTVIDEQLSRALIADPP